MTQTTTENDTNGLTGINALLYGSNELTETVLAEGDTENRILQISLDGTIASTSSSGLFSSESYDHQAFLEQLRQAQEDPTIKGILFEVNSPGGGVYESAEIAREIKKIKELGIPIYVSMTNMAASGGYYVSAAADKIYATEETVTGSIGVIMSSVNYSGLMEKLGIDDTTYKSGALKDAGSSTRPVTDADKEVLQGFVDSAYGRFVKVVAEGRQMSEDEVIKLADGRIYDGEQALAVGLIDALGYPDEALEALRTDKELTSAQLFSYNKQTTGFASTWLGSKLAEVQGLKPTETTRVLDLMESLGSPEAPKPLYYYGGE